MKLKSTLFLLFCLLASTVIAQESIEKLEAYNKLRPQEKVFVVTDRDKYVSGERIWFSAFLVDAKLHVPSEISSIVYVELIDNKTKKVVEKANLKMENGHGNGSFDIPVDLVTPDYSLRAYSRYMLNFDAEFLFNKKLDVYLPQDFLEEEEVAKKPNGNVSLQFFPEGGHGRTIGFKAIGSDGIGVDVEGEILNKDGVSINNFSSVHLGMGKFSLPEDANGTLTAHWTDSTGKKRTTILPKIDDSKAHIMGLGVSPKLTIVKVIGDFKDHTLVGHMRNLPFIEIPLDGSKNEFPISTEELGKGIASFTLLNQQNMPVSERLVFLNLHRPNIDANVSVNDNAVSVDFEGGVDGNYALSVIDSRFHDQAQTIESYMLLSSDVKGHIEHPAAYFSDDEALTIRNYKMDLLMMTQAWKKFNWDVNLDEVTLDFYPEFRGFNLQFQTYDYYKRQEKLKSNISLVMFRPLSSQDAPSNDNGLVELRELDIPDSTMLTVSAYLGKKIKQKKSGKIKNVQDPIYIEMLDNKVPYKQASKLIELEEDFDATLSEDLGLKYYYNDVLIEEVVIVAKARKQQTGQRRNSLYNIPDDRVYADSSGYTYTDIFQMLDEVAGVKVGGQLGNQSVSMRGTNSFGVSQDPLIILDGSNIDVEFLNSISVRDVDYVDVLKGGSAAIYGSQGNNGVIAIYTKRGQGLGETVNDRGIGHFMHPGYSRSVEFYQPEYDPTTSTLPYQLLPTVMWKAALSGQTKQSVPIPEIGYEGDFVVRVEGLTKDGQMIVGYKEFSR